VTIDNLLRTFLVSIADGDLEAMDAHYANIRELVAAGERPAIRRSDRIVSETTVTPNRGSYGPRF
jgi:hypothetical protein